MSQNDDPFHFEPPDPPTLEQLLPGFSFEALIAKGGMGAVYKARQISLDRDVAVKILPRELGQDPDFRRSFETEARAMAKLNHSNLIAVYDSGDVDGMPYIVMEYVPGKSLYHSAFNKKVDPAEAVRLIRGILAGLASAHEHGIIHRDIKPANILLTPKAEPKIGDFGLAVNADAVGHGLVMGTPGYTAPEVVANPHDADRRSDLYAVGVILYELLAGERPPVDARPPANIPGCPPAIDAVVQRATHPNPAFRYPDAVSMSTALKAADAKAAQDAKGATPGLRMQTRKAAAVPKLSPRKVATPQLAVPAAAPTNGNGEPPPPANGDGDAPQGAAEQDAPPEVEMQIGSNWGLIRNLLIIAGLIVAIAFTWKAYQKRRDRIAKEDSRIRAEMVQKQAEEEARLAAAKEEAKRKEAERLAHEAELARLKEQNPGANVEPEPDTPLKSLERLKSSLAAGQREEMPLGTVRRGKFDLFLVTEPMGWHQAAWFAEQHGGHLAVPESEEDLTWLAESIGSGSAWLGAGRDEAREWVTITGGDWIPETKPAGKGSFAALNDLGLVRGTEANSELPFFIQWHRDGSNPATLDAILQRIRESIDQPDPAFPPGTLRFENRNYLLVGRPLTWIEANRTAELSGGRLAVPSELSEAIWIEDYLSRQKLPDGTWLGGKRQGDAWTWTTGEPWSLDRWADGALDKPGTVLLADSEGKWLPATDADSASAYLIEWSNDHKASVADSTRIDPAAAGAGAGPLKDKCRELVAAALKEREQALDANARSFQWDLDVWIRGLSHAGKAQWTLHVQKLKAKVAGNRVPERIDPGDGIQLSEQMAKVATYSARKQKEIDDNCLYKLQRIKESYLERLGQQLADADRKGRLEQSRALRKMIQEAQIDADDLPDLFGIDQ